MNKIVEFVSKLTKLVELFGVNAKFTTEHRKQVFEYIDKDNTVGLCSKQYVFKTYDDLKPIKYQKISDLIMLDVMLFATEDLKSKTAIKTPLFKKLAVNLFDVKDNFFIPTRSSIDDPYPVFVDVLEDYMILISPADVKQFQDEFVGFLDVESF